MEEREGWISREKQRRDVEMTDAMIKVMVEASQQIDGGDPNPFKWHCGEVLPSNLEQCFSGFLVRNDAIKFKSNTKMLLAHIAEFKDQLMIGKFVGSKPSPQATRLWI